MPSMDTSRSNSIKFDFTLITRCDESKKLFTVILTTADYDQRSSKKILNLIMYEFKTTAYMNLPSNIQTDLNLNICDLNNKILKYLKPANIDKVSAIQSNLAELQQIMNENIEKVIERGVKLDELIVKTEHLNEQALTFQRSAKKINKCCHWL